MQKWLGTALHSYKKKRWGAVLSADKGTGSKVVADPIICCMQTAMGMLSTITKVIIIYCMLTAMGMLSTITKVIKSLLLQLVGPCIIT